MSSNGEFVSVGIVKTGYLTKRARETGRNWRKRYFVLNDNKLTYYASHTNLSAPKGDLLLVDDTVISDEEIPQYKFAFKVVTPFETIVMAAETNEDRLAWKVAFMRAMDLVQHSLRGYMFKKGALLEGNVRKFFVYHEKTLYVHKDHEHTTVCQGIMKINVLTKCTMDEKAKEITVIDDKGQVITMIFEQRNLHELQIWYDALSSQIAKLAVEKKVTEVKANVENATIKGILGVRPPQGGEAWKSMYVSLVSNEVVMMSVDSNGEPQGVSDVLVIDSNTTFGETALRSNSFEIITSDRVLHLCTKSKENMIEWLSHFRQLVPEPEVVYSSVSGGTSSVVSGAPGGGGGVIISGGGKQENLNDLMYLDALALIPKDVFYEVTFKENKAIGIVLERAGDWAVVKLADFKETGIRLGSALTFVNGDTVIFNQYAATIGLFKNWAPPLKLVFRMAPSKFGYLKKKSNNEGGKWRKYYYCLTEGKLCYKNTEEASEKYIHEMPLIGAVVTIPSQKEAGKKYCFKFISGTQCHVLHAHNQAQMREWAALLYHAIAIANGGKHIIDYERQRMNEEEARQNALRMQEVETENQYIVELIQKAMTFESVEELQSALDIADSVGLAGEYIDYARDFLMKMIETNNQRIGSLHFGKEEIVEEVVEEEEEEETGGAAPVEEVVEEEGSKWGPPATPDELRAFYSFYQKTGEDGSKYINVMLFSTVWRMVTGERGNLYKEMQMFNKFDSTKAGSMNETDFVNGWMNLVIDLGSDEYLCRIKYLLGDNNLLM